MEGPRGNNLERANIKAGEHEYARQGALNALSVEDEIKEDPEVQRIDGEINIAKQNGKSAQELQSLRDKRGERVGELRRQKGLPN